MLTPKCFFKYPFIILTIFIFISKKNALKVLFNDLKTFYYLNIFVPKI